MADPSGLHARQPPPRGDIFDALVEEEPGREIRVVDEVPPVPEVSDAEREHLTYAPALVHFQERPEGHPVEGVLVPNLPQGPRFPQAKLSVRDPADPVACLQQSVAEGIILSRDRALTGSSEGSKDRGPEEARSHVPGVV